MCHHTRSTHRHWHPAAAILTDPPRLNDTYLVPPTLCRHAVASSALELHSVTPRKHLGLDYAQPVMHLCVSFINLTRRDAVVDWIIFYALLKMFRRTCAVGPDFSQRHSSTRYGTKLAGISVGTNVRQNSAV